MAILVGVGLEADLQEQLASLTNSLEHEFISSPSPRECDKILGGRQCDVVFYYLKSNERDSWPLLMNLGNLSGSPDLIAFIPSGDAAAAEYGVLSGAWDTITTPCDPETVRVSLTRCLFHRTARHSQPGLPTIKRDQIIGHSPILERCLRQVSVVAKSDSSVLIMGETGTGKELFAKAVHDNSPRSNQPMIVVDCTNLPATLAESILFGHAKGSFTGAMESSDGLFKQADGGTVFLDEIGELDLNIQKSLLRVIQEKRFRPLSAKKEIEADFRIIAATNRDLEEMVRKGQFRQDLYHRLNTRTIVLPPLRDRIEDIETLAEHYTWRYCLKLDCEPKEVASETIEALKAYNWPGNVREMVNVIQAMVLNGINEHRLYPQHLPEEIRLFLLRSGITPQELIFRAAWRGETFAEPDPLPPSRPIPLQRNPLIKGPVVIRGAKKKKAEQETAQAQPHHPNQERPQGPPQVLPTPPRDASNYIALPFIGQKNLPTLKQVREEIVGKMEHSYLSELIQRSDGNFAMAQQISGLSRARLYELLQKHMLSL